MTKVAGLAGCRGQSKLFVEHLHMRGEERGKRGEKEGGS